jgi:hypothetical protein
VGHGVKYGLLLSPPLTLLRSPETKENALGFVIPLLHSPFSSLQFSSLKYYASKMTILSSINVMLALK